MTVKTDGKKYEYRYVCKFQNKLFSGKTKKESIAARDAYMQTLEGDLADMLENDPDIIALGNAEERINRLKDFLLKDYDKQKRALKELTDQLSER